MIVVDNLHENNYNNLWIFMWKCWNLKNLMISSHSLLTLVSTTNKPAKRYLQIDYNWCCLTSVNFTSNKKI